MTNKYKCTPINTNKYKLIFHLCSFVFICSICAHLSFVFIPRVFAQEMGTPLQACISNCGGDQVCINNCYVMHGEPGKEGTPLGPLTGLPGIFFPASGGIITMETAGRTLTAILSMVIGLLTIIGGIMFLIYFILGGVAWITSGGKAEQLQKAKDQMTNAAIGIIVIVAAYGIAFIVGTILGFEILNPAQYLPKLGPSQ